MCHDPLFVLDVCDRATGKQVALRLNRETALVPLGELTRRVLTTAPDELVCRGELPRSQTDTFFRLQDLIYPVDDSGGLVDRPYHGLVWRERRQGTALDPDRPALFERLRRAGEADVLILSLEVDRHDLGYERNWHGFHARRARRYRSLIDQLLREALPEGIALTDARAERRLVEAAARRVWDGDFESYSRFVPPSIRLKTGDETLEHLLAGRGGVCTEKVLALKFITDAHQLSSRVVFAGPRAYAPLPVAELRTMLDDLDSYDFTYARRFLRYWDHVALEYTLSDGSRWLVDPSGGAMPFLCTPAEPYLDDTSEQRAMPVRTLAVEEPVLYHRAPESLGLDFLFAWETWVGDVDLLQVFDNQLGLLISDTHYVTVSVWGSDTKRRRSLASWRAYAARHGLRLGLLGDVSPSADEEEEATAARFAELAPNAACHCLAALPGLARRYQEYVLARYGIDKPFGVDLIVIERPTMRSTSVPPTEGVTVGDDGRAGGRRRVPLAGGR